MIRNLPPIEQVSKLGYTKLYKLRKSVKTRLAERIRSLKDAEAASEALKSKHNPPSNALEYADIAFANGKVVELKSEIYVFRTYLDEIDKYLEPMLEQFKNVGQPGNE